MSSLLCVSRSAINLSKYIICHFVPESNTFQEKKSVLTSSFFSTLKSRKQIEKENWGLGRVAELSKARKPRYCHLPVPKLTLQFLPSTACTGISSVFYLFKLIKLIQLRLNLKGNGSRNWYKRILKKLQHHMKVTWQLGWKIWSLDCHQNFAMGNRSILTYWNWPQYEALWNKYVEFVWFIPQSLELRSIVRLNFNKSKLVCYRQNSLKCMYF